MGTIYLDRRGEFESKAWLRDFKTAANTWAFLLGY